MERAARRLCGAGGRLLGLAAGAGRASASRHHCAGKGPGHSACRDHPHDRPGRGGVGALASAPVSAMRQRRYGLALSWFPGSRARMDFETEASGYITYRKAATPAANPITEATLTNGPGVEADNCGKSARSSGMANTARQVPATR